MQGLLELAGEAIAVYAEFGNGFGGIDDVEQHAGCFVGGIGGALEQIGFEEGDAVEAPSGVGEFLDELEFGGGGGFVFVMELLAVLLIRGGSSVGRMGRRLVRPCLRAFCEERALPAEVRGPVE